MNAVIDLPSLHMTRDQVLQALEARRPWAERVDKKALAKHERDEKAYLAAFRSACRAALKWNYEKVKENYGQVEIQPGRKFRNSDAPSCPVSIVAKLDAAIEYLKKDTRKSVVLSPKNDWSGVHWLLTYDENADAKASLC